LRVDGPNRSDAGSLQLWESWGKCFQFADWQAKPGGNFLRWTPHEGGYAIATHSGTILRIKPEHIKAEIERLEKALKDCSDSGIRRVIEEWIVEAKQRLTSEQKKSK
jgi:hypothetical protein